MRSIQNKNKLTTRKILFRVLLVVFLVESVNELFALFGPTRSVGYHLFESIMLVAVSGPILWLTIARPLKQYAEQQKSIENERDQLLSLMESTVESTTDGIVVFDMDKQIRIHNRQYCNIWGISETLATEGPVACINETIRSQLVDPDEFDGHLCHLYECPDSVYHDVLHLKDGRVIERVCTPQNVDGQIVGRVLSYRDVTERVLAQKAIQESESRFRQIFEQSADAILLFNTDCTLVIDLNQVALKMFNYDKSELIGHPPDFLFSPEECRVIHNQTLETGNDIGYWVDILHAHGKDGSEMYVSVRCRRIDLADQQVLLCTIRDISSRVRAEEENRAIEAKLIQANKMTSLGVLVAGIAHEINNPNNYIMVSSELLSKSWKDARPILVEYQEQFGDFEVGGVSFDLMKDEIPNLLENITEGSRRIRDIVNSLKNFAREGKRGMRDDLNVNDVIYQATTIISHQIRRHTHRFLVDTDQALPTVSGNSQQIEQVLINLILNALQSLPDPERQVRVVSRYDAQAAMVRIEVSDQGIGIPDNISSRVLEPFFTTRLDKGGTGLGLSISNSIINDHDGTLTFSSSQSGTTFVISLPANRTHKNNEVQKHDE